MTCSSSRRSLSPRVAPRVGAGFTLVELVVVITVLGILAAVALPRFSSLSRDARLASLQALQGAIRAAAAQGYAACMLATATCSLAAPTNNPSDTMNRAVIGGTTHQFHYGYPIGWGSAFGYGAGIESMVDLSGFVVQPYTDGSYVRDFRVAGAPDPTQCYLRYAFPSNGQAAAYQTTLVTSGC